MTDPNETRLVPNCLPVLIGSLPLTDHGEAVDLIFAATPEIPLWPQLPRNNREGMVRQFVSGFPGLIDQGSHYFVDRSQAGFIQEMTAFHEHVIECQNLPELPDNSLFRLASDTARGFQVFKEKLLKSGLQPLTVKGQVTGPVTAGMGIKDERGAALVYDDNLWDMLVKLLAGKARWQVEQLRQFSDYAAPIIFIDEPGIVSFGSTAFAGISRELVVDGVSELIVSIKEAGGLSGIHICANGDWEPALKSATDIISFDAYSFFDNFVLYREQLISYLRRGGVLAWGIVPTSPPDTVENERLDTLYERWLMQLEILCSFGFSEREILHQTLIAPACGTGSLTPELALKVLTMTSNLADFIKKEFSL
ncbi:MAG: hypothetical protein KJN87_01125 [Desulfofustis sp.]|nr:hypothetical protein [Desulfofustis sp.]